MHLRPIQQKELWDFARVVGLAMWNDEILRYTAPLKDKYPESFFKHTLYRTKLRWYRGELLFLAVSDEHDADWAGDEVILGYCCYSTTVKHFQRPVRSGWLGNTFERFSLEATAWYSTLFHLNRSADQTHDQHFRSALDPAAFDTYLDSLPELHKVEYESQHWELELLGTHPNFRRRGVGKMMLQWGFEQARKDHVPLVLIASVMGEQLYLSTGFREVRRVDMLPANETLQELDLGMGEGKGTSWACMVWEPEGLRQDGHDKQHQNFNTLQK